ncbi:MAG: AbrB/MazE/SpoVT family DNA-binding domain-containing protein [Propionibacteriaceae bacterium]|nr:AbrB/MazE/SpoVT family DNA-binding domain-containing protein [Propionibacteriaceae bacterium]
MYHSRRRHHRHHHGSCPRAQFSTPRRYGTAEVDEQGRITLPEAARRQLGLEPGDQVIIVGNPAAGTLKLMTAEPFEQMSDFVQAKLAKLSEQAQAFYDLFVNGISDDSCGCGCADCHCGRDGHDGGSCDCACGCDDCRCGRDGDQSEKCDCGCGEGKGDGQCDCGCGEGKGHGHGGCGCGGKGRRRGHGGHGCGCGKGHRHGHGGCDDQAEAKDQSADETGCCGSHSESASDEEPTSDESTPTDTTPGDAS